MTGIIVALAAERQIGTIRTHDGIRLPFSATGVLGDYAALAIGQHVSFEVERGGQRDMAVSVFHEPAPLPAAGRKNLDLRYSGFDQTRNIRRYRFEAAAPPESTIRYSVSVDVALLLKYRVGVQEVPALCLRKLAADLEKTPGAAGHELSDNDLSAFVTARMVSTERKHLRHSFAGRRGAPPPGPSHGRREG